MKTSLLLLALGALNLPVAARPRRFFPDDLPKIVRVTDPQISPDGKTIAIVVGRANLRDDRYGTEIDFIDLATSRRA